MHTNHTPLLETVITQIENYKPRKIWWRRYTTRSAVAAVLSERPETGEASVLLMKRATRDGDPWSGHMSFPGGRADSDDDHVYQTAIRETWEEMGLDLNGHGRYIGRLSDIAARPPSWRRLPMLVTPFVFQLTAEPQWRLDPLEVDSLLWVPLSFLADHNNREQMTWQRGKVKLTLPCYFYQDRRIWGLTLRMLDELITITHGRN